MKALSSRGAGRARERLIAVFAITCGGWLALGCSSDTTNTNSNAPKYYEDVAPLLNHNCVGCHREGGIAPFALTSYDQVRAHAADIASATAAREMPPMPVNNSGSCNTYANARWLSDDEIALLGRWAKGGTLAGDASKAPALPEPPSSLTDVAVTLDMGVSYTPDASLGHDDYRCFVVSSPVDALNYVTAYEVFPGQQREVHHLIVYQPTSAAEAMNAHALDEAASGDGYPCFGGPGVNASPLAMWAPGAGPIYMPTGTGVALAPHRDLIFQIHYNLDNGTAPDQTKVALQFASEPPIRGQYVAVLNTDFRLQPGKEHVESTASAQLPPAPFKVFGVMPHMHTLGKTLHVDVENSGATQCLVDVDRWDFHWQNAWWYEQPLNIDQPQSMSIRCGFDTRERTSVVTWGESTSDEMCISYLYITTSDKPDVPLNCSDESNPLLGSCLDDFLEGCYEPDLNGSCSASDDGSVSWSDGSKIVRSGAMASLYGADDTDPCITVALTASGAELTKGDEQLSYSGSDQITIQCPDGQKLHATGDQLHTFNLCHGVNCPN